MALHYVAALKCGRPLTTKCLGDTDIRYNKQASNSAKDQSVVWTKMEGWFRGVGSIRIGVEQSDGAVPTDGEAQSFRVVDFANVTIKGSRAYYHTYLLSQTFALQEQERFSFFTTTHEKDGGLLALPGFFAGERSFTNRTGSGSSLYKASSPTSTPPPLLEATPSMTTPSTLQPLVPTKSMVSTALLAFVWTTNATFFTRL